MDDETLERLKELNAKPWRGACPLCPFRIWCTDTKDEALRLVSDHINSEHHIVPVTWKA